MVGVGTPPRKVGLASASPGFAWGPALGGSQAIFTRAKRCSGTLLKYCSGCGVSADEARCLSNCDKRGEEGRCTMVGAITVQADYYYFRDRSRVPSGGGCHLLSKCIISKIIIYIIRHKSGVLDVLMLCQTV